MGKVLTNPQNYADIAEAIRAKGGTTAKLRPDEMAAAIEAIQTGGGSGGDSLYYPVQNENTTFSNTSVRFLNGGVAPTGSGGLPCTDLQRSLLTSFLWSTYTKWEIGIRIFPITPTKATQVLFGCYYSGQYYYAPSMELYSDGRIGLGHTHTAGKWTTWFNNGEKWVDFNCWNFIRAKYADGTVTITLENDNGVKKKAEFPESAFAEVTNASYRQFAFGQIARNNNYAYDTYFDLDNTYILADGEIIFGRYARNRDPGVTA